ncbi:Hypothetical_protein [Hexamita inflata]|uniref:Hypothetical_protein n=1 Tax=Hexamita inflata TaxID=28002 RepID=A0AA86NVI5_9EUKA|nr:Hypothetical protein HINF_LOCUS13505 [Hexamita inflata]
MNSKTDLGMKQLKYGQNGAYAVYVACVQYSQSKVGQFDNTRSLANIFKPKIPRDSTRQYHPRVGKLCRRDAKNRQELALVASVALALSFIGGGVDYICNVFCEYLRQCEFQNPRSFVGVSQPNALSDDMACIIVCYCVLQYQIISFIVQRK